MFRRLALRRRCRQPTTSTATVLSTVLRIGLLPRPLKCPSPCCRPWQRCGTSFSRTEKRRSIPSSRSRPLAVPVRLLAASLCLRCQAINSPAACQCARGQALSPHRCWRRGSSSRNCGSSFATRFAKRAFLSQSKFARQHESMCLLIQDLCELRGDLSGSLLPRRVSVVAS